MGPWLAVTATIAILLAYEAWLLIGQRSDAAHTSSAHANLREEWFAAVSSQKGTEILAVQTLRNSLMSATMIASTAVLGLMGTITLTASSLHLSGTANAEWADFTPRLAMQMVVLGLLFASLVSSVLAVRFFNHASYVCGLPVDSEARQKWAAIGSLYSRKAGLYYSWALRQLILVTPIVASILHPVAGLPVALVLVSALAGIDRFQAPD